MRSSCKRCFVWFFLSGWSNLNWGRMQRFGVRHTLNKICRLERQTKNVNVLLHHIIWVMILPFGILHAKIFKRAGRSLNLPQYWKTISASDDYILRLKYATSLSTARNRIIVSNDVKRCTMRNWVTLRSERYARKTCVYASANYIACCKSLPLLLLPHLQQEQTNVKSNEETI